MANWTKMSSCQVLNTFCGISIPFAMELVFDICFFFFVGWTGINCIWNDVRESVCPKLEIYSCCLFLFIRFHSSYVVKQTNFSVFGGGGRKEHSGIVNGSKNLLFFFGSKRQSLIKLIISVFFFCCCQKNCNATFFI